MDITKHKTVSLILALFLVVTVVFAFDVSPVKASGNEFGVKFGTESNPENFYFFNESSKNYDVPYKLTDYGSFIQVQIKNQFGYSVYQIHDSPVGVRLFDSRDLISPLVSTSFFVPERFNDKTGKWTSYGISNTKLSYNIQKNVVVVNRTSQAWGSSEDELVESYCFGVNENVGMVHKITVYFNSQSEDELHRLTWQLTGIESIIEDETISKDFVGNITLSSENMVYDSLKKELKTGDLNINWLDSGQQGLVELFAANHKAQITWENQTGSIFLDPSFSVTDSGSEISIINSWDSGASGFNCTIPSDKLYIDRLYDYSVADWVFDGDQSDVDSTGFFTQVYNGSYYYSSGQTATWTILEANNTRITLYGNSSVDHFNFEWTLSVYSMCDVFYLNNTVTYSGSGTTLDQHSVVMCDKTQDETWTPTKTEDNTDDVYQFYSASGGLGVITLSNTLENSYIWDDAFYSAGKDYFEIDDNDNQALSTNEVFQYTLCVYVHGQTTDAEALTDELDDEICDAFPSIYSLSGVTYDGRNNSTGAFDFSSTTSDLSFSFSAVDTEQNYAAFYFEGWNSSTYYLYVDDSLKTEDTDYYASYNASSTDLVLVYPDLFSSTLNLRTTEIVPSGGTEPTTGGGGGTIYIPPITTTDEPTSEPEDESPTNTDFPVSSQLAVLGVAVVVGGFAVFSDRKKSKRPSIKSQKFSKKSKINNRGKT